MNRKCGRVDRLVTNHHLAILIDQDQITNADGSEMLAERVEPEVVREDRVADTNVPSYAFIEAALGEDAKGTGEVLFAVEAVLFGGEVGGVLADLEFLA